MASWLRLDIEITAGDADFDALYKANPAFPWLYEGLLGIAKRAADVDPEQWRGHLVSLQQPRLVARPVSII